MNTINILPDFRRKTPKVYAYSDTAFPDQLKVGYTERDDVMQRIREQYPIKTPSITYRLEWHAPALFADGSGDSFTDKDLHRHLKNAGFNNKGEWRVYVRPDFQLDLSRRTSSEGKLMKFATRIPIFMYLTDYREEALIDIIRKLEPELFKKVTGLSIDDFELLVSVGVFNDSQMNDAILKFRRYEDSSLVYTGVNKHETDEYVGAWSGKVQK